MLLLCCRTDPACCLNTIDISLHSLHDVSSPCAGAAPTINSCYSIEQKLAELLLTGRDCIA